MLAAGTTMALGVLTWNWYEVDEVAVGAVARSAPGRVAIPALATGSTASWLGVGAAGAAAGRSHEGRPVSVSVSVSGWSSGVSAAGAGAWAFGAAGWSSQTIE